MNTSSSKTPWIVAGLVLVVLVAGGGYVLMHRQAPAPTPPAPAPVATVATAPTPAPEQHPISEASVSPAPASTTPLPSLDDSDGFVRDEAARYGDAGKLLVSNALIQRIVATVNALPGDRLPSNVLPVHGPRGSFQVSTRNGDTVMAPANAKRYARYADVLAQADTQQLVDWYVHAYPLFEDAWRQLGYPKNRHFNARLVQVLDLLLKTPVPAQPPKLVGADGLYHFVDPQLENLAIGQKILLRLGPDRETAVKAKLHAIRAALTGRHPTAG